VSFNESFKLFYRVTFLHIAWEIIP